MKRIGSLIWLILLLTVPIKSKGQVSVDSSVKIISYNIWNGFEEESRRETFIQWVQENDPEIVALQELVGFTEQDLAALGATYGHPYVAILKEKGYPVGITSKQPIEVFTRQIDDYWHGMMHVKTYNLDVIVIHLSPFEWSYRLKEARAITAYIENKKLDSYLIMGDFNSFSPFDADVLETRTALIEDMKDWDHKQKEYRNMRGDRFDYSVISEFLSKGMADACQLFVPAKQRTSYPTSTLYGWEWGDKRLESLGQRLDYIMVAPRLINCIIKATVHNGKETDTISDHYPVSIELKQ